MGKSFIQLLLSIYQKRDRYIGKRHIAKAITMVEKELQEKNISNIRFVLVRVPFFLEPDYINKPADFWETHDSRMIRKFGSKAAFERVKKSHGLSMCSHYAVVSCSYYVICAAL